MTDASNMGAAASASEKTPGQVAAERVCHEEQMQVWSNEVVGCLSMGDYLRDDLSYDDGISLCRDLQREIRRVVESAFDHPELAALSAPPPVPESVRRLGEAVREVVRAAWNLTDNTADGGHETQSVDTKDWRELAKTIIDLEALIPEAEQPASAGHAVTILLSALAATPAGRVDEGGESLRRQRDLALEALHTLGVRLGVLDPAVACDGPQLLAAMDAYSEHLASSPAPDSGRVAEGYRLVPVEPTEEMWQAGREADAHPGDSYSAVWAAMIDAAPAPAGATGEGRERVRHVKRGTEYEVLGEAEVQVSWSDVSCRAADDPGAYRTLHDGDFLTVYRCLTTGKLWCRFTDEFRDGRFQPAPSPAGEA